MSQKLFSEEDLLPISALADLVYCERRAALHHLESIWEDNLFTMEGTLLHERASEYETEVRGDIRIVRGLRLRSLRLGLAGKADVVEFYQVSEGQNGVSLEGVSGQWQPVPIEYKRGILRKEEGYEVQLCAQALCLEEMLKTNISVGAIYYGKTKRRLEIAFTASLRQETEEAVARLHRLLEREVTPLSNWGPKCTKCSLSNLCLPKAASGRRDVQAYITKAIFNTEPD